MIQTTTGSDATYGTPREPSVDVLHLDESSEFSRTLARFIEQRHDGLEFVTATDVSEVADCLNEGNFDCVVTDHHTGAGINGVQVYSAVRSESKNVLFVFFTSYPLDELPKKVIADENTLLLRKDVHPERLSELANWIKRLA